MEWNNKCERASCAAESDIQQAAMVVIVGKMVAVAWQHKDVVAFQSLGLVHSAYRLGWRAWTCKRSPSSQFV